MTNNTHPSNLKVRRLTELPQIPQEEIGESVLYATANNKDYKVGTTTYVDAVVEQLGDELAGIGEVRDEAVEARNEAVGAAEAAQDAADAASQSADDAAASATAADGAAQARVQELRNDLSDPTGGAGLVSYLAPGSGAVKLTLAQESRIRTTIEQYGGGTEKTAAENGAAFNRAVAFLSTFGGGAIDLQSGATYEMSGASPLPYITVKGNGATLKAPNGASAPIIEYNSATILYSFNLYDLTLDGNAQAQDIIRITEPSPSHNKKTWFDSTLFNCVIRNSGGVGIYCPIPGRVRVQNCRINNCDIGIAWDREHMDLYGSQIESCRIGVRSTGNHFTALHSSFAHNTEAAWSTTGAGLGTYTDVYEAAFIGCTFIDNPIAFQGTINWCRVIGNRFTGAEAGANDQTYFTGPLTNNMISGNELRNFKSCALDGLTNNNVINGNVFICSPLSDGVGIRATATASNNLIYGNRFSNCNDAILMSGTATQNKITDNLILLGVNGIRMTNGASFNEISANRIHSLSGDAISFAAGGTVNVLNVRGNVISSIGLSAIRISNSGLVWTMDLSSNTVNDANTSGASDTDAISVTAGLRASGIRDNTIRNAQTNVPRFGVFQVGVTQDCLMTGNITRNVSGATAYSVDAAIAQGTNVGTFD